jgi:hypothetical protein
VILFVYRRKKENLLTWSRSKSSAQEDLINLNTSPQMVLLVEFIIWNGSLFNGTLAFQNEFSLPIQFGCNLSNRIWILTNVYGPCQAERKVVLLTGLLILICLTIWIG